METITASVEKQQMQGKPLEQVSTINTIRKHVHVLPSGRRLKIVADNETELQKVLFALQS